MQEVRVAKFWRTVLRPAASRRLRRRSLELTHVAQRKRDAPRGWSPASGGICRAEVAVTRSAAPDRPSLEAVLHHLGERRTRVQLLVRHACNDCISILNALFVDDPRSQPAAGK